MTGAIWSWAPAVAGMAAIFLVSSIPDLAGPPGGVPDKVGHYLAYAGLGALFVRAFAGAIWANVSSFVGWRAWTAAVFYGATDEFHQRFVVGRTAALDDWLADALGAATAVIVLVVAAEGTRLESAGSPPAS